MAQSPDNLLVMFKRTLPTDIINELLDHPDENTYAKVMSSADVAQIIGRNRC